MYRVITETRSETFRYREDLSTFLFDLVSESDAKSFDKEYYFATSLGNKEKCLSQEELLPSHLC